MTRLFVIGYSAFQGLHGEGQFKSMSEHQGSGDAPNVRGDLAVFFGPRGKGYLAYYDERQQRPGAPAAQLELAGFRRLDRLGRATENYGSTVSPAFFLPLIADYFFPFVGGLIAYVLIALFAKEACLRGGFSGGASGRSAGARGCGAVRLSAADGRRFAGGGA